VKFNLEIMIIKLIIIMIERNLMNNLTQWLMEYVYK
jgi:hypothetical protein